MGVKTLILYFLGNETALRAVLFNSSLYDLNVRPEAVTNIVMTFVPTSLGDIDIRLQTMTITGWWNMKWNDSRLVWDPSNYGGISSTHIFQKDLWTPTVVVSNSVDSLSAIDEDTIPLRVTSAGLVEWEPPGILTVSCSTDITYFPFDVQICPVSVKTSAYTINELLLSPVPVDTSYYHINGEWTLVETYSEEGSGLRSLVSYQFKFQRKPEFYGLNLVLPVLLCWILNLFIFLLPAQSGEKIGYGLTVLLAFVVLMSLVADRMPTTADHVSFLEVFVVLVMAFCTVSVAYSIFNVFIYHRNNARPIPDWLRRFVLFNRNIFNCRRRLDKVSQSPCQTSNVNVNDPQPLPLSKLEERHKSDTVAVSVEHEQEHEVKLTWSVVAGDLDSIMFKMYFVLTFVLCLIMLSITGSGTP